MMSKPAPETKSQVVDDSSLAFASPPSTKTGTVEDLERRLAMLGGANANAPAALKDPPPMQVPAPVVAAPTEAAAPIKGGKNALLVRERIPGLGHPSSFLALLRPLRCDPSNVV